MNENQHWTHIHWGTPGPNLYFNPWIGTDSHDRTDG